ncbi:MAG: rhomboid family intramembrane serine protease [Candidatus Bathyarchaeia archaeon]
MSRIRADAERLSQKPTGILIIFNLLAYAVMAILGGNLLEINPRLLASYGQVNLYVLEGEYWRLFTSLFVHANLVHLLGNMLFLLIFGRRAEELFGKGLYCAVYFCSGLIGNLLTLLWGSYVVSVGASGAIFGVFGASVIYIRQNIGQSVAGALIYSFYIFIMNVGANVNLLAHFGGLAAGLILGYSLSPRDSLEN